MYSAQKGFTGGLAALHIGVIAGVVTLVIGLTGFIVVPLRALRVKTVPEFYELRFSRGVRILGGLILALSGILNMGLFLKAGAIFVAELTGLNDPLQLKLIMTAMIVLVLVYTILGGMVSVVITDFVQFIVLSIGLMLACLLAVRQIGWSTLIGVVSEVHGPAGFDPLAEGAGFGPTYVMWMIITAGIVSSAVWQTALVRASAAESVEAVRRLYTWSSIGMMVRFMLPQFLGVCALAYLWNQTGLRADFFTADGGLVAGDQSLRALPVFLGQLLPTGLIGLIGAGMLAAFMSTHDSYLLCWGSVLSEDVVHAAMGCRLSVKQRLLLARSLHPAHRRVSARVEPLVPARTRHVGLHGHHGRDLLHERAGPPGRGPVLEEGPALSAPTSRWAAASSTWLGSRRSERRCPSRPRSVGWPYRPRTSGCSA